MKKATLFGLVLLSFQAQAQVKLDQQLDKCAKIDNDIARLQCFDALVDKRKNLAQSSPINSPVNKLNIPTATNSIAKKIDKDATQAAQASAATNPKVDEDRFGKPAKVESIDSINSSILGTFKGWKSGMVLELANGQKWRVTSKTKGHTTLENPRVTIKKAVFGTFNMTVEGFVPFAKVKRIK